MYKLIQSKYFERWGKGDNLESRSESRIQNAEW